MEKLMIEPKSFISLIILLLSTALVPTFAVTGAIQRTTKQQVITSLPPTTENSPTSQLFITSPSGDYSALLSRRETAAGAGGFGNDFCYIEVVVSGKSIWESECTPVSTLNACSLVFSDVGLEIYDGSRSAWDTDADGDHIETLVLVDNGDLQLRDKGGDLVWKASEHPLDNQNCGSVGSPGLTNSHPPFASPISGPSLPFGQQPLANQPLNQQPQGAFGQPLVNQPFSQQQQQPLGYQSVNQPFSAFNQPFGNSNNQPLVDNNPFDSSSPSKIPCKLLVTLVVLMSLVVAGFLV